MPGIYFHSLFGSRNDRAAALETGINRRINRQKFDRATVEAELANPDSLRARVFSACRKLLRVRRAHAAFSPAAPQRVFDLGPGVFAVLRGNPEKGGDRSLSPQPDGSTRSRSTQWRPL
ncbi:MAG: hypothetical protein HC814_01330 [Rhodobacteraceae bacterium]|nr:hypothetical protein [Paracoccaceae bacterium]